MTSNDAANADVIFLGGQKGLTYTHDKYLQY